MGKTGKQVVSGGYHRPVCFACKCELRPEINGVGVLDEVERERTGGQNAVFVHYEPYELYDADLWKCPKCGIKVVGGFALDPIARHGDSGFNAQIDHYRSRGILIENTG